MSATGTGLAKTSDFGLRGRQTVSGDHDTPLEFVPRKPPASEGTTVEGGVVARAHVISIDEIYRAPEADTKIGNVLKTLRESAANCDKAVTALDNSDPIGADSLMMEVRAVLPELFCVRRIGDGFAEVINALESSFENLSGELFSLAQIRAIRDALIGARNEPRMSFEKSLRYVLALEDVGLKTEPTDIDTIAGCLDE
jgi:hypothetical protein